MFGRGTGEVGLRVAVQRYYLLRGRALVVFSGLPSLVLVFGLVWCCWRNSASEINQRIVVHKLNGSRYFFDNVRLSGV